MNSLSVNAKFQIGKFKIFGGQYRARPLDDQYIAEGKIHYGSKVIAFTRNYKNF